MRPSVNMIYTPHTFVYGKNQFGYYFRGFFMSDNDGIKLIFPDCNEKLIVKEVN